LMKNPHLFRVIGIKEPSEIIAPVIAGAGFLLG